MTHPPTLEQVPTPPGPPPRPAGPGLPPRRLPRLGPARSAVPGLVLAAERLMVLRPLYLGFTILTTVPTPLCYSRGKTTSELPSRESVLGEARWTLNTNDVTSARATRLPESARRLPKADPAPPLSCSRLPMV